ncbi:MAG TPA: divergent polysaccharide deacetylase family protein, partial [Rhizomicrobium sp.]
DWPLARLAPPAERPAGAPRIAIVIDDLGSDLASTDRAIRLPKAVALSFLPYADATPRLSAEAVRGGHEVLLHMPMEAQGEHDPGPLALTVALAPGGIRRRLDAALARVPDAVGINNHMGSRFTQSRDALIPVAEDLAARHLLFFDSRTTPATQVVPVARAFGVASAGRDVFLDDEQAAGPVATALRALEARARTQGVAIAIGHPHDVTLAALGQWTARAAARGFVLVPLSEAIRLKTGRETRGTMKEGAR